MKPRFGFIYTTEVIENGIVVARRRFKNLMPTEGLNYIASLLKGGTQFPTFYLGAFEGNYTPVPGDTMAAFPAAATELIAYESSTRPAIAWGDVAGGGMDNAASKIELVGTTDGKQVTGLFISSSPVKGGTTGILLSAARSPSPDPLKDGAILRCTATFVGVSL